MGSSDSETICAQLTPIGRGAVAVVAVAGPLAEVAIQRLFRPINGRDFLEMKKAKIVYGLWLTTEEDLIVVRHDELSFEVHCHGGSMASAAVLEA